MGSTLSSPLLNTLRTTTPKGFPATPGSIPAAAAAQSNTPGSASSLSNAKSAVKKGTAKQRLGKILKLKCDKFGFDYRKENF